MMRPESVSGQFLMKYKIRTQFKSDDQKMSHKSSKTSRKNPNQEKHLNNSNNSIRII